MESLELDLEQKIRSGINDQLNQVRDELKKRYQRDFEVHRLGLNPGDRKTEMILSPVDEPELLFHVSVQNKEKEDILDDYVPLLTAQDMRYCLLSIFPEIMVNVIPLGDGQMELDASLSLKSYLQKHTPRVMIRMAAEQSCEPEIEILGSLLQDVSERYEADIVADLYVYDSGNFEKAIQQFNSMPVVSSTILRELNPFSAISLLVKDGGEITVKKLSSREDDAL